MTTRDELLFDAEMSAKYHRRRATFLERASSAMSVAILAGGAGAFASLFGETTTIAKFATLIVAIVGIVQIVFQTDRCAAEHRRWLKAWSAMITEIRQTEVASQEQLNDWVARRYALEGECVGEMRALQEDCYNRTMVALERQGAPTPITAWQRMWMQLFSFENAFQRQAKPQSK
jgi:hypothetical protein